MAMWSYDSWIYNYLCNRCLSSLMLWVRIPLRARCTTLCDKVCQRLVAGWWFSSVSSPNKTYCHYIIEILLKATLNSIKPKLKYPTSLSNVKVIYNAWQNIYCCKNLHLLPSYLGYHLFFYQSRNWLQPRPSYQLSKHRQK